MAENMIIKVLVKGTKAQKEIGKVEAKVDDLGDSVKEMAEDSNASIKKMSKSFKGAAAGVAVIAAAVSAAMMKGREFDKMAVGLSDSLRDWAKATSELSDITSTEVVSFLKAAESAGLSEQKMKDLATQAIALGAAFPNESTESINTALIQLSTSGEKTGFVVDILEQRLGAAGIAFKDMDMKSMSAAQAMDILGVVTAESQNKLGTSKYKELNKLISGLGNSVIDLGDYFMELTNGALKAVNKGIDWTAVKMAEMDLALAELMATETWFWSASEEARKNVKVAQDNLTRAQAEYNKEIETTVIKTDALEKKEKKAIAKFIEGVNKKKKVITDAKALKIEQDRLAAEAARIKVQEEIDSQDILGTAAKNAAEDAKNSWANAQVSMADGMAEMVVSGKASFKDLTQSIIKDLIRIYARMMAVKLISGITGLFNGGGGGGAESLTSTSGFTEGVSLTGGSFSPPSTHTGGIISHHAGFIPSYHVGLRTDERLARLQVGEAVVNRAGTSRNKGAIDAMNKGAVINGGGNSTTADIKFEVTAIDAASFNNYLVSNKHVIENIISRSLSTNGSVRQSIRAVI